MKTLSAIHALLLGASFFAAPYVKAATLTWDPAGSGTSDGGGAWLTAGDWWDGASNVNWTSGDDAIFGNGGAGGAVTLASPTTIGSLTFNSFTGTYTLGTSTSTITLNNGITMNSGAGAVSIISPITLGAAQSWLNNDDSLLTVGTGAITNGGFLLTVGGSGNTSISSVIGGTGGLTKQDGGVLTLSGANTFSGQLTVANGTLSIASINNVSAAGTLGNSALSVILGSTGGNTGTLRYTGNTVTNTKAFTLATGGSGAFQVTTSGQSLRLDGLISGSGNLIKTGSGILILQNSSNSYTGKTIVNGGELQIGTAFNSGATGVPGGYTANPSTGSNIELNGGILSFWFDFNRTIGTGAGQLQITGGISGFTQKQGDRPNLTFNTAGTLINWGSAAFSPEVLVLNDAGAAREISFNNLLNLNGADRTIATNNVTHGALMNNVISNSTGTAGLIKTGVGALRLGQANSFNGAVTVNQGTLTVTGNLANGGSNSALGSSSNAASNLLLGNGTTLQYTGGDASTNRGFTINGTANGHGASLNASGTGAVNWSNTASPAYGTLDQNRTLTLTGTNTGNNILAANIANNGSGAVSVTKTGAGVWVISGTNDYTGVTTISNGTLSISTAANLGTAAANLVFNGGTLRVTGTGLNDFADLGRTNAMVLNAGQNVGLDIADAGNTFTIDQTINHTGGLSKAGAGTLAINSAHTYTGQTTVTAGTLRLDDGGVISSPNLNLAGGTFAVNRSATATLGTDIPVLISGTGSLANIGAGTMVLNDRTYHTGNTSATVGNITLSHQQAIQNSALNTTGAGFVTLSGTGSATPIFGGLANSGTTRNLADVISTGFVSVTNLTLNPQSGSSFTYGGVIADGAAGMNLTKTGAGTQTLTGTNTYTGTTFLNGGTLTLSSSTGKLSGTTDLNFNGGTLQFSSPGSNGDINAINNAATITVNSSSTFSVTAGAAGGASNNETVGAVTLNAGQMNFNWTNGGSSGTLMTLTSLSRSGTASANFNSGFASNSSRWAVTGSGSTAAGQIIGPWATTGGNAAGFASTDYAVFASGFVAQANIAGSAETTWTTAANAYTMSNNQTLTGSRTITALRNATGSAAALGLSSFNLETYGLLTGTQALTVSGTGALTTPTGGGNLFINANGAISVAPPINNNGGAVTLVKNGSGTLTLSSTTSNYSGGTVINAGTLATSANTNLGGSGGITVNGSSTWSMGGASAISYARALTINEGATLTLTSGNAGKTVTGVLSGNGTLFANHSTDFIFSNASNTFTGAIISQTANSTGYGLTFASIGDTAGAGLINLIGGSGTFRWSSASGSTTTLANRQFAISGAGGATISAFGTTAASNLVINQDLLITGAAGARTLQFAGTNTGNNTFAGKITDGPGSVVSLSKAEAGTWILSGANTFTGTTTVSTGILVLGNALALQNSVLNTTGSVAGTGTAGLRTTQTALTIGGLSGDKNFAATGGVFSTTSGGYGSVTALTLNSVNNTSYAGVIANGAAGMTLTKTGIGTQILTGNQTYTGATNITNGILQLDGSTHASSTVAIGTAGTLTGSGTVNGNATLAGSGIINKASGTIAGTLGVTGGNWNGNGVVTGLITSSSGTFNIGNGANLTANGNLDVTGGTLVAGNSSSTITGSLNYTSSSNSTFAGIIAGSGKTLTMNSANTTLTLSATNTYSGATTVSNGILAINGTGSINSSAVTVNGGNFRYNSSTAYTGALTLTSGTISGTNWNGSLGNQTVATGDILSPGNSPGTATTTGQTWAAGGTYEWEINSTAGSAGLDPGWDLISGSGTLDITAIAGNEFTIDVMSLTTGNVAGAVFDFDETLNYNWMIANFDTITGFTEDAFIIDTTQFAVHNTFTGTFDIVLGNTGSIGGTNNQVWLTYTAIPEPKAVLLGCLGVLLLLRRRR